VAPVTDRLTRPGRRTPASLAAGLRPTVRSIDT
jgi:hypothetical protein